MLARSVLRVVAMICLSYWSGPATASIKTIALTTDSTPEANGQFGAFSVTNATAPVLNNAGDVVFWAGLFNTSGAGNDDTGIYLFDGMTIRNVVREHGSVPEGSGRFNVLSDIPSLSPGGQVAFDSSLRDTPFDTNVGTYLDDGNVLINLARRGDLLPDGDGAFSQSLNTTVNSVGHVRIKASLVSTSGGANNDLGVYLHDGSGLIKLARENEAVPEGNGLFSDFFDFKQGYNDADQVAFQASLRQTSGGSMDDEGIYLHNGAELVNLVRENTAAPEGNGLFAGFPATAMVNSAGQVAFAASLRNTSGGTIDNDGIYLHNGTVIEKLAREHENVPEGEGKFAGFDFPVVNDAGQVAFTGYLRNNSGGSNSDSGIYLHNENGLLKYLRENDNVPEGNGRYDSFGRLQLNASGQVAFKAFLRGTSGGVSDDNAIYVTDGTETVKVAREGDMLEGAAITFVETTGGYAGDLGQRKSFNDFGQVAFRAVRANGSQGIFLFTPEIRWRSSLSGSWDAASNWTLSLPPGAPHNVTINSVESLVIAGPASEVTIHSLTVGDGIDSVGSTLNLLAGSVLNAVDAIQLHSDAMLGFEIGGTDSGDFSRLTSAGIATLGGVIAVQLIDGFQPEVGDIFSILAASGGVTGMFETTPDDLPALPGGHKWEINYGVNDVTLSVVTDGVIGDTNGDGAVNIEDLNNVRNNFGGTGLGDTDANGTIDISDLNNVRNNFGVGSANSVPEPSTYALATIGLIGTAGAIRQRKRR